jgi:hypothetical protein
MLKFLSPTMDRVPTQTRDTGQTQDTTASPLNRQQPNKAPSIFLIESCYDAVDRLVLLTNVAIWMKLTSCTGTVMNGLT